VTARGNRLVGAILLTNIGAALTSSDNGWSLGRATAGMAAYPALPR
jgi:hypothetical protein